MEYNIIQEFKGEIGGVEFDDKNIRLSNAHKYVETLVFNKKDDLDIAIAEHMNSRIIKDIQYQYAETSNFCTYSVLTL